MITESSVGSSSEVNSLVGFQPTEKIESKIKELGEIMENLDLGESSGTSDRGSIQNFDSQTTADFTTRSCGVSNSNEDKRRSEGRYTNNVHQMCIIITEAAEDNVVRNDTMAKAHGDNPENNHRKEKEKIHVLTGEWRKITSAFNHGTTIPADSRRELLMGYQYALHQHKKKLLQEKKRVKEKSRIQQRVK
jgi:hypothetical protein